MSPNGNRATINLIPGKKKDAKSKSVGKFLKVDLDSQRSNQNDDDNYHGGGAESD